MNYKSKREVLKGILIGIILTFASMGTINVMARVGQDNITVHFNNINVAVNGQTIQTSYEPFIFEGRTFLPVSDIANAVGYDVTWEATTNTVHLTSRKNVTSGVAPNYPPHNPTSQLPVTPTTTEQPSTVSTPIPTNEPSQGGGRPSNPAISQQRAIEIAEADLIRRGINATLHSTSGMDFERDQWVWELEFRVTGAQRGRHVIEYYINVNNGNIVKFEWGD